MLRASRRTGGTGLATKPPRSTRAPDGNDGHKPGFGSLIGPVQPVKGRQRVPLSGPAPPPRARFAQLDNEADDQAVLRESLATAPGDVELERGDELSFRRPHVPFKVLRDLKRGKYTIQDNLDLHGLTAREARLMLQEFMADALRHDRRCVRIVHGKGLRSGSRGPALKQKLNQWLPLWQEVLAFTSAPARDGGTGALYVLLAR